MSIRSSGFFPTLLLVAFLIWIPLVGFSQAATESQLIGSRIEDISVEMVQAGLEKSKNDKSLSDASKKHLEEIYTNTLSNLKKAQEWEQKTFDYSSLHASAAEILKEIKTETENLAKKALPELPRDVTLPDLENLMARADIDQKAMKSLVTDLDKQLADMSGRRIEAPKALADAKQRREALNQASFDGGELSPELQEPAKLLRLSQTKRIDREIAAIEKEMDSFDERLIVLKSRRDLRGKKTANQEGYFHTLKNQVNENRRKETEQSALQAQNTLVQAAGACPTVQILAQENAGVTIKRQKLAGRIEEITSSLDRQSKALRKIRDDFKNIQDRIKTTGFTDSIGILLRVKRNELPETDTLVAQFKRRKAMISRVQVEMFELDDKLLNFSDLEALQEDLIQKVDPSTPANQLPFIKKSIGTLLKSRKEFYEAFSKDLSGFFSNLVDLDSIEEQLVKVAREYTTFIDERVLWIKSCQAIRTSDLQRALLGISWVFSPTNIISLFVSFGQGLWNNFFFWFPLIICLVAIYYFRRKMIQELDEIAKLVPKATSDQFAFTSKTVLITVVIAIFRPLILLVISQVILSGNDVPEYARAVSASMFCLSSIWFFWEFVATVFLPSGLADVHFNWGPREVFGELRQQIGRLIVWSLPLFFFFFIFQFQSNEKFKESIGRVIFVVGLFVLARLAHSIFYPPKSTFTQIFEYYPTKLIAKLGYVIYFLTAIFPAILALGALAGYFYTSQRLIISSFQTLLLSLGILFLYSLAFRATQVQRRSLALKKVQENTQESERPETAKNEPGHFGAKVASASHPQYQSKSQAQSQVQVQSHSHPEPNIYTLGLQTQKFLLSIAIIMLLIGFWLIWGETLPAIRILDRVELWTTVVRAGHGAASADGTVQQQFIDQVVPVTLMDLIIAIGIGVITVIGSRNIPGFLEFSVLQRLPLDSGIRYAIRTLSSYSITIIGGIALFQILGIGWDKVQWLAAGMSVGLGFGLQEIFANFVSGLILLFERPIRVGDIITVGDSTGTVSKIEIRATTVIDWDRKEIIIPNREFITGKLMNWTLSDSIQRVVFKIGVAYGTDTDMVHGLLLQVAWENRDVLKDPPPKALFRNFGDSSLDFELRVFIPNMDNYQDFLHQINTGIDKSFKKAGVAIPFPQRDLHVRTVPETLFKAP